MKKLLRPLHRQRSRRKGKVVILNDKELCDQFAIDLDILEEYLTQHKIDFHKDSQGQIWASIQIDPATRPGN